jgi:hypothetical protein
LDEDQEVTKDFYTHSPLFEDKALVPGLVFFYGFGIMVSEIILPAGKKLIHIRQAPHDHNRNRNHQLPVQRAAKVDGTGSK